MIALIILIDCSCIGAVIIKTCCNETDCTALGVCNMVTIIETHTQIKGFHGNGGRLVLSV